MEYFEEKALKMAPKTKLFFLRYLNGLHSYIQFTRELAKYGYMAFLGIMTCEFYRKPTHTNLFIF